MEEPKKKSRPRPTSSIQLSGVSSCVVSSLVFKQSYQHLLCVIIWLWHIVRARVVNIWITVSLMTFCMYLTFCFPFSMIPSFNFLFLLLSMHALVPYFFIILSPVNLSKSLILSGSLLSCFMIVVLNSGFAACCVQTTPECWKQCTWAQTCCSTTTTCSCGPPWVGYDSLH